jgi:hypothetical protein
LKSNKLIYIILFLALASFPVKETKADDLNKLKMEQVTKAILDIFVNGPGDKNELRKYISEEWLDKKNINIKKYKINNYSPEKYDIIYTGADVCIATIGGASWAHLLVFKFTEEYGKYRVIPLGISKASSDYIDPWYSVKDYICSPSNDEEK